MLVDRVIQAAEVVSSTTPRISDCNAVGAVGETFGGALDYGAPPAAVRSAEGVLRRRGGEAALLWECRQPWRAHSFFIERRPCFGSSWANICTVCSASASTAEVAVAEEAWTALAISSYTPSRSPWLSLVMTRTGTWVR